MQWYAYARNPFGESTYAGGRGDVGRALDDMEEVAAGMPILMTEFGMPSSTVLNGSEELQAEFVRELLPELRRRRDGILLASWWMLHDLADDVVEAFTQQFWSTAPEVAQGPDMREYLRTSGLYRSDGSAKPGVAAWKEALGGV